MYRQLSAKAKAALEFPDTERIKRIYTPRWVDYDAASKISEKLRHLLLHPPSLRMPGLLIISQTNNGKTALVNEFRRLHSTLDIPQYEATITPVLLIQAPPVPDERRLLTALVDRLAIPHKLKEDPYLLLNRLGNMVPKLGVRMIIIDEIHHISAGTGRQQRSFLNVIKHLGNELGIPIVGVGTQDAFNAISTDPQLTNRFEPAVLPRWQVDRPLLRLLMSFERVLPLRCESNLSDPAIVNRLFGMSEGTIGELSSLINRAAEEAILTGEERITPELLDRLDWIAPSKRREVADAIA